MKTLTDENALFAWNLRFDLTSFDDNMDNVACSRAMVT